MEDILNGYALVAPFQNKDAGFCRWTFARNSYVEYFIKEFLDPVYPTDDSLSEKMKQSIIRNCDEFQEKRKKLYQTINDVSDGNLVRIKEFFRYDSHYYITTEKVQSAKLTVKDVSKLPVADKLLLCAGIAHSMMMLEKAHIVHGDIKETNIILQRTAKGKIVGKIIDFDGAFFENNPPESEDDLGGDQVYLSPEALMFMCGEDVELTCKMDVFALGILFHQYITGEMPVFNTSEYDFICEAVLDDAEIRLYSSLGNELSDLIRKMLLADPKERISISEVFKSIDRVINPNANFEEKTKESEIEKRQREGMSRKWGEVADKTTQREPSSFFYKPGSLSSGPGISQKRPQNSGGNSNVQPHINSVPPNINTNVPPNIPLRPNLNTTQSGTLSGDEKKQTLKNILPERMTGSNVVKIICPMCGYKNEERSLFCEVCGKQL